MVNLPEKLIKMNAYDPCEEDFCIKLDANESYIPVSQGKKNKIAEKIMNMDFNRYPDPSAKKVRELASELYGVSLNCIAAGNGSDELISVLVNSFCSKGGKMMVLEPDFSMYKFYASLAELTVVGLNKNQEFLISVEDIIKQAQREKTQILIFSNPCNPTGRGLAKNEVLKIANELSDTLIIADEAYMDFWNESVLNECTSLDNLLVLKTMSKAYGMAAIRLGFVIGNEVLIDKVNKARSPYNVNALTQAVAEIILDDTETLKSQTSEIIKSKANLENQLSRLFARYKEITILPSFTNFVVVKTQHCEGIFERLKNKGIIVRLFAKYSFLRITTGSEEENNQLLKAFEEILKEGF